MALPNTQPDRVNNDSFITEEQAVGLLEKEWKNLIFLALIVFLGIWFYSEYKETISQREGEASSQFSTASTEISSLVDEVLKGEPSKELLEKEDRILNNLSRLIKADDSSYSAFASVLKTAFFVFRGKEVSNEDAANLDRKLAEYKNSRDTLIFYEIITLLKCRLLLESGQIDKGLTETKALLKESKIIFPEIASVLLLFSPDASQEESKAYITETLKSKPELEEQTKTALYELGYSL